MPAHDDDAPVVVVGGALAGLAAAARVAKTGRRVILYEREPVLGGRWAATATGPGGALVDTAESVIGFLAPWRDLFRKSGRPLEAELARIGYRLAPAGPQRVVFADGAELVLPAERGEQHEALVAAYGDSAARRWQELLDGLDELWQTLRRSGVETERRPSALTASARRRLLHRRRVADLAQAMNHPHLRALVRSVAYRAGSTPERAPALTAIDLALGRRFGRWQVQPQQPAVGDCGRASVLTQALVQRLELREVQVRTDAEVLAIEADRGGVLLVRRAGEAQPASAVVLSVDPWTAVRLAPRVWAGSRRLRTARPALAPQVSHRDDADDPAAPGETVALDLDGVPVVSYRWRSGARALVSEHDYRRPSRQPAYGLDVRGFRGWVRRPDTRTGVPGLYFAGPSSPAGPGASQVLLSAALAAYAIVGPPV